MLVGVGGQGTLLASRILGNVLLSQGYDVKVSEVHGMSQRGGSVVTYIKFGEKVYSPVIEKGQADIIVSFEALEAARWVSFLKKGGKLVMNTQEIEPMPVITGAAQYPANIVDTLKSLGEDVIAVDALSLAKVCDGALLVVQSGGVTHQELRQAAHLLQGCGLPLLGTVLNRTPY